MTGPSPPPAYARSVRDAGPGRTNGGLRPPTVLALTAPDNPHHHDSGATAHHHPRLQRPPAVSAHRSAACGTRHRPSQKRRRGRQGAPRRGQARSRFRRSGIGSAVAYPASVSLRRRRSARDPTNAMSVRSSVLSPAASHARALPERVAVTHHCPRWVDGAPRRSGSSADRGRGPRWTIATAHVTFIAAHSHRGSPPSGIPMVAVVRAVFGPRATRS